MARRLPPSASHRLCWRCHPTKSIPTSASITRREALRGTVIFSAGALLASRQGLAKPTPPTTRFDSEGIHLLALGDYGTRGDNKVLIREWGPILNEYPISLCFGGHDHIMQHVRVEGYQPSFIISGAGGAKLYDIKPTDRGFVSNHHLGFNHIHVTPDEINVQYISASGKGLHHFRRDQSGRVKVQS